MCRKLTQIGGFLVLAVFVLATLAFTSLEYRWAALKLRKEGSKGRSRARAQVGAINLRKFTDAASAYLLLACMQGKSFPDMVLSVRKDSGEAHLDYLVITMENVTISKFETIGVGPEEDGQMIEEILGLVFENVTYKYTVQADDHSAGDEHEITYDIAAGV